MKGKQRIKLLKSQKILLQTKKQEILNTIQTKQNEFNEVIDIIMVEQGISKDEIRQWRIDADMQAIEKLEPKKPPKDKDKEGKK